MAIAFVHGLRIDRIPIAVSGPGRRSDTQVRIELIRGRPRRGKRGLGRDGLPPIVDGSDHFLALATALRDLGHNLLDELGQRPAREPQRLLGTVLDLAIHANIHLRHAANSTHVDHAPFTC